MPIPMMIPTEFLAQVTAGQVLRYGCILKNVGNGQIIGHLKEVGGTISHFSSLPVNPLAVAGGLAQVGQWIDTHQQLARIQQTLNTLQLISTVGAVASVAGLGVSVLGFVMVTRRLGRLEEKLDLGLERLHVHLQRIERHQKIMQMAHLKSAWQQLDGASHTEHLDRGTQLLREADKIFLEHRNFYASLIEEIRPTDNAKLTVPQVVELYGRFIACSLAELEANFYLEDFKQWHFRHAVICKQLRDLSDVDFKDALHKRAAGAGLLTDSERDELRDQLAGFKQFCQESQARLETCAIEIQWVQQQGIRPADYKKELAGAPDEGVVLIPHK